MKKLLFIYSLSLFFSCTNKKVKKQSHENENSFSLSYEQAKNLEHKFYQEYADDLLLNRSLEIENKLISIENINLKYHIKFFGEMPLTGWSLFISLHGGGGVDPSINERQWNRHKGLYQLKQGILLTPRSPTDTWNMWHQEHIDKILNRLIQNMIAKYKINPNKVFLLGYSAGGDGVYQLAPRMADRFAAASMSAGHPNDASPLGLRNIGFAIHMGENDSAYNRNTVAVEWKRELENLKNIDPSGYNHIVKIYENRGHQISHAKENYVLENNNNGIDSSGILWMSKFTRIPYPKKIVWRQDDVTHNRFYWLKVNEPEKNSLIIASIEGQLIKVSNSTVNEIIIRLNDKLLNMDDEIKVMYRGKEIFSGHVPRRKDVILSTLNEYGDPESIYYGEISVSFDN